jgi:hypothetical protein
MPPGKPTLLDRSTRLALVAGAALCALFDAGSAAASCGDYVMVGGHSQTRHETSLPDVPRCHGPNCQRQAPPPVLPTKGLPNAPPSDTACCPERERSASPSLSGGLLERRLLLAEGHPQPLLRPPSL